MQSRFTIFDPVSRQSVRGVGSAHMSGAVADAAYRIAERACGETLMFDDTCPHGTAYAICEFEASVAARPRLREHPPVEPVECGHFGCRNYMACLRVAEAQS